LVDFIKNLNKVSLNYNKKKYSFNGSFAKNGIFFYHKYLGKSIVQKIKGKKVKY